MSTIIITYRTKRDSKGSLKQSFSGETPIQSYPSRTDTNNSSFCLPTNWFNTIEGLYSLMLFPLFGLKMLKSDLKNILSIIFQRDFRLQAVY